MEFNRQSIFETHKFNRPCTTNQRVSVLSNPLGLQTHSFKRQHTVLTQASNEVENILSKYEVIDKDMVLAAEPVNYHRPKVMIEMV